MGIYCDDINPVIMKCHLPQRLPGVTKDAERYLTSILVDGLSHNQYSITVPRYQALVIEEKTIYISEYISNISETGEINVMIEKNQVTFAIKDPEKYKKLKLRSISSPNRFKDYSLHASSEFSESSCWTFVDESFLLV